MRPKTATPLRLGQGIQPATASAIASRIMSTTNAGADTERRVIDRMRAHASLHPLGHESLVFLDNHAVLLGHEEPGRAVLPQRSIDGNADARRRDWPLHRRQYGQLLGGRILGESGGEGRLRQIDQPMIVGRSLGASGCGSVR